MNTTTATRRRDRTGASRPRARLLGAISASLALSASCSSTSGNELTASLYGYPTDAEYIAAAGYDAAYVDNWGAVPYSGAPLTQTAAGAAAAIDVGHPMQLIHAAARGDTALCPSALMFEPTQAPMPCEPDDSQTGVTLTFTTCRLRDGGILNGMLQLSSTRSASDRNCDADTTLTVNYRSTYTDLSYTDAIGRRTVIKTLTNAGRYQRALDAAPSAISTHLDATVQRYAPNGQLLSDRSLAGDVVYSVSTSPLTLTASSSMIGTNASSSSGPATVMVDGLTRDTSCCHATAGTVTVTGEEATTFQFGPSCGAAKQDDDAITLGACP